MGGDLNLKKSWHPVLMSNQKRVWAEEKKALDERKKTDQVLKERAEERQIEELERLQEVAGGRKRIDRVDWMYNGPGSGGAGVGGVTEEMEGYLLGKRRLDGLVKRSEAEAVKKDAGQETFMALNQNANTARDTIAKVANDPMLAIKKQEQAAYEAMMNDPTRRRQLMLAAGKEVVEDKEKASEGDTVMKTMTDARAGIGHIANEGGLLQSIRVRDPDHLAQGDMKMSGAMSVDMHRAENATTVCPVQGLRHANATFTSVKIVGGHTQAHAVPAPQIRGPTHPINARDEIEAKETANDDRAAKLAAMQANASELESDRKARLADIAAREAKQRAEDDRKRSEKGRFVGGLRREAEGVDLGRRLQDRRAGGRVEED